MWRESTNVIFKKLDPAAIIPVRSTPYSAGFDLFALEPVTLRPGAFIKIRTGIAVEFPPEVYGKIECRSGNAAKFGMIVGAGVIDADYTGELMILGSVLSGEMHVPVGGKIAQLVPIKYSVLSGVEGEFSPDRPGDHVGFGSTGST